MQSISEQPGRNILPIIALAIMVLFIFAMFSGNSDYDKETDFYYGGNTQKNRKTYNSWFAVEVSEINRDIAKEYNISHGTKGVIIVDLDGSRDVFMKLREGDVITGINDREVHNLKDFRKAMQDVNPIEGMFLDIQRNGYPMYVSVNGANPAAGRQPVDIRNPHPFSMTDVAPFMGKDIDIGGINVESGIVGKQIERWVESNFGKGFHACPNCGTLVPSSVYSKNKRISCPNCGTHMVSK